MDHLKELERQVEEIKTQINAWDHASDAGRRLAAVPGNGPITSSALVASTLSSRRRFEREVVREIN
ncbi:hypothetical protein DT99_035270 [Burkholderia seminalis]|uniref:Transposase n=2 Tax=Burkholderia cepacia complex TaxID=87882 RepID=A0A8A8DF99_9BURK|nr:hypothetical protein DT99_035270 [Burkholderia seminalis]